MSRQDRVRLIRAIERKRGSRVIVYLTSDRPNLTAQMQGDVIPIIERQLRALVTGSTRKIDLFLYSRGGDINVPWSLVSLARQFLGDRSLGVLIPFRAHSGATVLALGADEIVITRAGEFSPIDATIERGPHNPRDPLSKAALPISVEDARGFFTLLETIGLDDPSHKSAAFAHLAQSVHPLALGSVNRILDQTKRVAGQMLESRIDPLSEAENKAIVDRLSSEIGSHAHTIRFDEAVKMGITFARSATEEGIEDEMWALFEAYAEYFELNSVFQPNDPFIADPELNERWYKDLPIACIEGTKRFDVAKTDLLVRRTREVPPQVNFNLQSPQFTVSLPPDRADPTALQEYINQVLTPLIQAQLKTAANAASKELLKAMPQKGFEHVQTNSRWVSEAAPKRSAATKKSDARRA